MNLLEAVKYTKSIRNKQYSTGKVGAVDIKYIERTHQLFFTAQAVSSNKSGIYKLNLIFNKITAAIDPDNNHKMPYYDDSGNVQWYLEQPTVNTNILTRCSCQDYYFMWAYWNKKEKSLVGPYKPYIRVQPPSGRPPVNPDESPGLCKHLLALIKLLMQNGIIKRDTEVWSYISQSPRV